MKTFYDCMINSSCCVSVMSRCYYLGYPHPDTKRFISDEEYNSFILSMKKKYVK